MKLIFAIVQAEDCNKVMRALSKEGISVTKLNSSGGFLRVGNVTLLTCVDDKKVDKVISIFKENCNSRKQLIDSSIVPIGMEGPHLPYPVEIPVGGATIIVTDVDRFEKV
jgi:uncharacterized protein YaaQ